MVGGVATVEWAWHGREWSGGYARKINSSRESSPTLSPETGHLPQFQRDGMQFFDIRRHRHLFLSRDKTHGKCFSGAVSGHGARVRHRRSNAFVDFNIIELPRPDCNALRPW